MTVYKPHEFAKLLGVTVKTLQRWDNIGRLKVRRSPSNRRYYTDDHYRHCMGIIDDKPKRKIVAYTRVSSRRQRDDLKNQTAFIWNYTNAHGIIIDEYLEDIGSGLNYHRDKWNKLLNDIMNDNVETIYITYRDRFVRFGYERFDTKIIVLNDITSSPEHKMIEDLTSIIHVFSCRLYGLRKYKYKSKIKTDRGVIAYATNLESEIISQSYNDKNTW